MNRRSFLATSAALVPRRSWSESKKLRLAPARQSLVGAAHPATDVWAYNGSVPGPELRFKQGERLRIEVENALGVDTTMHWHGVRLPNAMDGVPHLTQAPIAAKGGRFIYDFELKDAGTFWYHPHLGSPEQVGRGLYGALIVEEPEPPAVRAIREVFGVRAGERIRLRLINASNARIYGLRFEEHQPWIIALDGHPVAPHWFGRLVLGPGMRADVILDCVAAPGSRHRVIDDFYGNRAYELLKIQYGDEKPLRQSFEPAPRLAANPLAQPDVERAERQRIVFGGGMMGAMPNQREHRGLVWTVNGKAVPEQGHHHAPLATLVRGRSYIIELVNQTSWHHPIHLHGHVFRLLTKNGKEVLPRQ